jgi:hypothetical protein
MIPRIILLSLIAVFTAFMPLTADAKKLFIADIGVTTKSNSKAPTAYSASRFFDNKSLEFFPDYTPDSAVLARVDLRGVGLEVEYHQNSSVLIVRIPSKNFEVTFDGGNRNESQEQFEDWLKGDFESPAAPSRKLTTLLHIVSPLPLTVAGTQQPSRECSCHSMRITGPFISSRLASWEQNFLTRRRVRVLQCGLPRRSGAQFPINYKWNFKSGQLMDIRPPVT